MSIKTIFRNIDFTADKPLREGRFPLEDFSPSHAPDQLARLARPKFSWMLDRFPVHPPVLHETLDPCLVREILRRFKNPLLNQVRLDVVVHEQSLICRRNLQGKRAVLPASDVAVRRPIRKRPSWRARVTEPTTGRLLQESHF